MNGRSARDSHSRFSSPFSRAELALLKRLRRSEQARVQELEEAPQLAEMILDRRAAQRQPMSRPKQPRRFRRRGRRVLDRLRFVENRVVELDRVQSRGVAPERAVGRQHEIGARQRPGITLRTRVVRNLQLRREASRFVAPVEHERARHDDDRGLPRRALPFVCRRASSRASTMTVFPRPMSSARQPPNWNRRRNENQPSASRWYSRSVPRNERGGSSAWIPLKL